MLIESNMYNFNTMESHFPYHNGSFNDIMSNLRELICLLTFLLIYIRNIAVEHHNSILKELNPFMPEEFSKMK